MTRVTGLLVKTVVALVVVATLVLVVGLATIDRWLFAVLDPGPFDPALTPPPVDYSLPSSWAALPASEDGADVALAELPATDQTTAAADVFYLHPTTFMGPGWNGPIDTPEIIEATARGGTLIQASAFNACCAIYAPRYRQAHGKAFVEPSPSGQRAIEIAYADVAAAFDAFLQRYNHGRPFILAGHSQGTVLATRLLREKIWPSAVKGRLVAAYLIGGPLTPT